VRLEEHCFLFFVTSSVNTGLSEEENEVSSECLVTENRSKLGENVETTEIRFQE